MNAYLQLFLEALTSILVSIIVLFLLSRPLMNTLVRICPDAEAAAFWHGYTRVMLTIAPLLLVLVVDLLSHFSDPLDALRLSLIAALGGMLIGLRAVGKRLGKFVVASQPSADAS